MRSLVDRSDTDGFLRTSVMAAQPTRVLARDRTRQNALQLHCPEVRIVRFTWQDLARPAYITSVLARAAGRGC